MCTDWFSLMLSFECSISFKGVLKHLYGRITFSQSFQKSFSCSAIVFVSLVESQETSESEPGTFRVTNIPRKSQAAMPLSLKMKVKQISPFLASRAFGPPC